MSFALVACRPSAQSPGWRAARWKLRRGMPVRKLGRIQSRGRNRRAGWIDSNSLGILKGYFTSVRATEHKTSCCIVASSAITHWQSNPLGRKVAMSDICGGRSSFSEKPVIQQLGSLIPCSKHLVRNNGTDLSECLALSLRKSFLHVDAISPSRSSLWPTLRELILNQNA